MTKYYLFAGDNYYPMGGLDDLANVYESLKQARKDGQTYDWYHVVTMDGSKPTIVASKFPHDTFFFTGDEEGGLLIDARRGTND